MKALTVYLTAAVVFVGGFAVWANDNFCTEGRAHSSLKRVVADKLKSPSTASFVSGANVEKINDCYYRFAGSVDSQNDFGAIVRSDYSGMVMGNDYSVHMAELAPR